MLRKLIKIVFFTLLFIFSSITKIEASCTERENCPFENYPYCVENVPFTECFDQNRMCWESGTVDEQGYVDCAYTYRPSPTPTPLPSSQCGHEGEPCCPWPEVACQDISGRLSCIAGRCLPPQCEETVPGECSDCRLSVDPKTGDTATNFRLNLYCLNRADCKPGTFLLEYEITPTEEEIIPDLRLPDTIYYRVCGETTTLILGSFPVQGNYTVKLRSTFGPYIRTSLGNPIETNFIISGEGELTCGQAVTSPTAKCPMNCPVGWFCSGRCDWFCLCGHQGEGCCPEEAYNDTEGIYPECFYELECLGGICVEPLEMFCEEDFGIQTAIGCIPIDVIGRTIEFFINWSVAISGGVALLLIAVAAILLLTSAGYPERIKAAKELVVSVIAGVIMIIFSIFLLRVIGINILGLPGFE